MKHLVSSLSLVIAVVLLAGCTTMTPTEKASRDYENAVAYEARVGYKWTQIYVEKDTKLRLKDYDLTSEIYDLNALIRTTPSGPEAVKLREKLDLVVAKRNAIRVDIAENAKRLAPALALQNAETYASYRRDYSMQESLSERERIENKRPESAGAMFPGKKAWND